MRSVGVFEAKTPLSQLLVEVEKGGTIVITKHGRKIAVLSPVDAEDMIDAAGDPSLRSG